jgi:serine/threonine protein kinase
MAPEVVSTPKSADWRADYFSAGCILAEMLCGRRTFNNEWSSTTMEAPEGLDEIGSTYGADVQALVADLLQKAPASRLVDPNRIRERIHDILQVQRSKTRRYWSTNWPELDAAMESQLRAFLFDDARSFRHGRLPRIGSLLALHAERTELVEFGSALEEIHRRIWLIMTQLRTRAAAATSEADSQAYLLRQLEEVRSNCDQLLDLIDGRIPASLQSRLNFVEPDARLLRSFQVLSRRAAWAYRRERSSGIVPDVQRRLDAYHDAMARLWRAWLRLQISVVQRISQCSDLLMVAMSAIR